MKRKFKKKFSLFLKIFYEKKNENFESLLVFNHLNFSVNSFSKMTNSFPWFNPNYFRIIFFSSKKKIQIEKNSENINLKIAEIQMTFLTF